MSLASDSKILNSPLVSLILPTRDESENILLCLENVHSVLNEIPHELIVVDDDSPDLTWKKVEEYSHDHPWVRIIRRINERGLSSAVLKGFDLAKGQLLAVMDADGSHDEHILPQLIQAIQQGADMAIGSRRVPGGGATKWPWYRRGMSEIATQMARMILNVPLLDPMSGYFVLSRALYESCRSQLRPQGYKILLEIFCQVQPKRVVELPFVFRDRKQGHSKLSFGVVRDYLQMVVRLRMGNLNRKIRQKVGDT